MGMMARLKRIKSEAGVSDTEHRSHTLDTLTSAPSVLADEWTLAHRHHYQHNIENMIGTVKIPVGIAGPIRVKGRYAKGEFQIPLATTEATLVASYHRGSKLITEAGGCTALLTREGVRRAPGFAFRNLNEVQQFVEWIETNLSTLRQVAESCTRFGKLIDLHINIEGNHVYLGFEYEVGDAAGQNMVTIATHAVCDYINHHSPVAPQYHFVEANLSGDKKASALSFVNVRGKKVSAEIELPAELVEKRLHTSTARMVDYWRMSAIGGVLSGSIGVQGHYANGLAALYIACGQDAACVAESAVGVTRFELTQQGGLYAAVTLPNLIVGTVGGGTGLPSQHACLELMGLAGAGNARAFAEVTAALMLAGELSIIGALSADQFASAHQRFARGV
jgi:hydroxymethylglutaryl-CoA reductase (NADPH)